MNIDTNRYNITKEIKGHVKLMGKEAGNEKNHLWHAIDLTNGKEVVLMYCETDSICILCPQSYQKILDYERVHNEGKKITFTIQAVLLITILLNIILNIINGITHIKEIGSNANYLPIPY